MQAVPGELDSGLVLSTIANSAAALSAILGGFLVVRAASLRSTRETRTEEVARAKRYLQRSDDALATARVNVDTAEKTLFLEQCLADIIQGGDSGTGFKALYRKHNPPFLQEAIKEEFGRVRGIVLGALRDLRDAGMKPGQACPAWADLAADLNVEQSEDEYYRLVYQYLELVNNRPPATASAVTTVRWRRSITDLFDRRLRKAKVELNEAKRTKETCQEDLESSQAELEECKRDLDNVPKPQDAINAYRVLTAFALFFVILPLLMLAASWALSKLASLCIVVVYAGGIAAVLYVLHELIVEPPDDGEGDDDREKSEEGSRDAPAV